MNDVPAVTYLILGIRSGTSWLAKRLYDDGYNLRGPLDTRPMPGSQPGGHYENVTALMYNNMILHNCGASWHNPKIITMSLALDLMYDPAFMLDWIKADCSPQILKEPRFALTWPVWRNAYEQAGVRLKVIFLTRDMEKRIDSIVRLYGYSREKAAQILSVYNEGALQALDELGGITVPLEFCENSLKSVKEFVGDDCRLRS